MSAQAQAVLIAVAVAILAVAAGTLDTAGTMLIAAHDLDIAGMAYTEAALTAFGFCWLARQRTGAGSQARRQAARSRGQDEAGFRAPAPMAAELSALSREFDATVLRLRESHERERRMERSRRQLIAWAIRDLRTPLAGLQAMTEAPDDGIAADASRYHRQIHPAGPGPHPSGESIPEPRPGPTPHFSRFGPATSRLA